MCKPSPASKKTSSTRPTNSNRQRYIVVLNRSADPIEAEDCAKGLGGRLTNTYRHAINGFAVELPGAAVEALKKAKGVRYIEPDAKVSVVGTQTNAPWGLDRSDQRDLPLDGTYTNALTSRVPVYVIDTGVNASHIDFGGRVTSGFTAINDGRGTTDCNGHGTHVAGTVAGTSWGIAKSSTVVPVRVLDCNGSGTWTGVIQGIDWVVADHVSGPAVANLSLGGGASRSVDDAINRLIADGVTVVVAAGNDGNDACNYSPARVPGAITVGATSSSDARASWSNTGSCLDLFAPGVSIRSAWHTSTTATNTISGTSMAAPHVAGAAALVLGADGSLTPSAVASRIVADATVGKVSSPGTGSPNALLFTGAIPVGEEPGAPDAPELIDPNEPAPSDPEISAPEAPTNVTASAGRRQATVRWAAGADGGATMSSFTVYAYTSAGLMGSVTVGASASSVTIKNLRKGTTYWFTVRATNSAGTSEHSTASNTITPR